MKAHPANLITIVLVEDHPIFLDAVRGYIEMQDDFDLCGCADNPEQALALVSEHVPDIVLLDLELDHSVDTGIALITQIRAISPTTNVVVLTGHSETELIFPVIKAGAATYLLKNNVLGPDVAAIIHQVYAGEPPVDPDVARRMWAYFEENTLLEEGAQDGATDLDTLTNREREVLDLLMQRKSNQEIADELVISLKTAKKHVSNILGKLHVSNRTELQMLGKLKRRASG